MLGLIAQILRPGSLRSPDGGRAIGTKRLDSTAKDHRTASQPNVGGSTAGFLYSMRCADRPRPRDERGWNMVVNVTVRAAIPGECIFIEP